MRDFVKLMDNLNLRLGTIYFCALIFTLGFGGCSEVKIVTTPMKVSDVRKDIPLFKEKVVTVRLDDMQQALMRGDKVNSLRLVPVYSSTSSSGLHEYKLFEVQLGSVYRLLDLQNGDVLIAAQGYVIPDPNRFPVYISLISKVPDPNIEIQRGGQAMMLRYKFVE